MKTILNNLKLKVLIFFRRQQIRCYTLIYYSTVIFSIIRELKKFNLFSVPSRIGNSLFRYKPFIWKTRYVFWLISAIPWKVSEELTMKPLSEATNFPYSWMKAKDVCKILYKNTNFFHICSEQQTLTEVQLKENLPYYLYITDTEELVGNFSRQFLLELEPYYYKLVFHILKTEYYRDPLAYVRFAIDPEYRQLLFTQVSKEYLLLAQRQLSEVHFIEFITQKYSLEAELAEQLQKEVPLSPSLSTYIDLLYTWVFEHLYIYLIYGGSFIYRDWQKIGIIQFLAKLDPLFTITLPMIWGTGALLAWTYYKSLLAEHSDMWTYVFPKWWMKIRYFFLINFNLDIDGDDQDIIGLFLFFGVAPYYYCKYLLNFKIDELRNILVSQGLPINSTGTVTKESPVFAESPILFLIVRHDMKNMYYRATFNRALIKHKRKRSKRIRVKHLLPRLINLYPARQVSCIRFLAFVKRKRLAKSAATEFRLGPRRIFSAITGYSPLLSHVGGRNILEQGRPYFVLQNTDLEDSFKNMVREFELFVKAQEQFSSAVRIEKCAYFYKNFTKMSTFMSLHLNMQAKPEAEDVDFESLDSILYSNQENQTPYDKEKDPAGVESTFTEALFEKYPQNFIQRRGKCLYYQPFADIFKHYPGVFTGLVDISKAHTECVPYYKLYINDVIEDLQGTKNTKNTNDNVLEILALFFKDLWFYSQDLLEIQLQEDPVAANPEEYIFTYEQLYKSLKETPQLVILELLNNEWFDFRLKINPALHFEELYSRYDYLLLEKMRTKNDMRVNAAEHVKNDVAFSETLESDMNSLWSDKSLHSPWPADTFVLTQNLLYHVRSYMESRSNSKVSNVVPQSLTLPRGYPFMNSPLRNFPTSKKYMGYTSAERLNPSFHYRRKLKHSVLADITDNYILESRIDNLVREYLDIFNEARQIVPGQRITWAKAYLKYDYEAQITHDGAMDSEVFNYIKKYGIPGDLMYTQTIDAMIRRWGEHDPFIQKIQQLYKHSRLDAFLELDPLITKEINSKLKVFNLKVSDIYHMTYEEFKEFLDRHRIPQWLLEASAIEKTAHMMSTQEKYKRTFMSKKKRRFLFGKPKQPPVYFYTDADAQAVKENRLVSWVDQPAAVNETKKVGVIDLKLLDRPGLVQSEETRRHLVYGRPLRHLKFLEMYDPKDAAYHQQVLNTYMMYITSNLLTKYLPAWANSHVFRILHLKYIAKRPYLDAYDMKLHNLLQRLEKQFGLARELAQFKTKQGRYLCAPRVVEYCELFKFFENIDRLLPKLLVGFSKNDDELDLTYDTFATYKKQENPIIQQYQLNVPNSQLYLDTQIAYKIYAPFTFEELVLFSAKYENVFFAKTNRSAALSILTKVNRTYLKVIRSEKMILSDVPNLSEMEEWDIRRVNPNAMGRAINSIFPVRDAYVHEQALKEKFEHAEEVLEYKKVHSRLMPIRRHKYKHEIFPFTRYRRRALISTRIPKRKFKVAKSFLKFKLHERKKSPLIRSSRHVGEQFFSFNKRVYRKKRLIFGDYNRKIYCRNLKMIIKSNKLLRRNLNSRMKDLYLQYLIQKTNSIKEGKIYNAKKFIESKFTRTLYSDIYFRQIDRRLFDVQYRRYLQKVNDSKRRKIFLEHNIYEKLPTFPINNQNVENLKTRDTKNWIIVDLTRGLMRKRKHISELQKVEKLLDHGQFSAAQVFELRKAFVKLYRIFIFNPRVRKLATYIQKSPRRNLWFPEISTQLLKILHKRKDIIVLEDIFFILYALNHAAENRRLRGMSFKVALKAYSIDLEKPNLFLFERLRTNKIYPQEVFCELAIVNLTFLEKVLRLRRILDLEYNIKVKLFEDTIVDHFKKYKKDTRLVNILSDLKQNELHFLYFTKGNNTHAPLVPRFVFYAKEDDLVRDMVKLNLKKVNDRRFDLFRIPMETLYKFNWRYFKKYVLTPPILVITDWRAPLYANTLYEPQKFLLFSVQSHQKRYDYYKSMTRYQMSNFKYECMFIEFFSKYSKRLIAISRTEKEANLDIFVDVSKNRKNINKLTPVKKGVIDVTTTAVKKSVEELIAQCKDVWTRLQPKLQDDIHKYKVTKMIEKHQKYKTRYRFQSDFWRLFYLPDSLRRINLLEVSEFEWRRRVMVKNRTVTKNTVPKIRTRIIRKRMLIGNAKSKRRKKNLFLYTTFNHTRNLSLQNLLDEAILTGFYSVTSPKLSSHFYQRLLFTGLELSTGKPTFGVWLNWSYGKPVKLWFPIFSHQKLQMLNGATGLIFLPRLTSYIDKKNIIVIHSQTQNTTSDITVPFLEHKTVFSFLKWNSSVKERELWLHFFIYRQFRLLPGDLFYDLFFTFLFYQINLWEYILKNFW